jgi:hypothetical protein
MRSFTPIARTTLVRCAFTVFSLISSLRPICLFGSPWATRASTSGSRSVSVFSGRRAGRGAWRAPRAGRVLHGLGHFSVNRNTGAGRRVPVIKTDSTVRVRTLGGTLIASGTF